MWYLVSAVNAAAWACPMRSFHSPAQQDSLALFRQQTEKRRFLSSARPKGTKKSHPHLGRGWQDHQKHSRARSLAAPARCAQGNTPHAPAPPPAEYPQLRSAEGGCGGVRGRGGIEPCFPCVPFPKVLGLLGEGSDASVMSRLTTRRCPSASLRLRANPAGLRPSWALPFAPVHPACSRRLRRFAIVTPRLFATAGFPPIRDRHSGLRPPYAYPSLRSIQPAHDGSALRD